MDRVLEGTAGDISCESNEDSRSGWGWSAKKDLERTVGTGNMGSWIPSLYNGMFRGGEDII